MKYRVEGGVAQIGTDMVLGLSSEQAAARAYALEKVEGGYRPKIVVQFKAGEVIGISAPHNSLPRSLAEVLVPVPAKRASSPAKLPSLEGGATTDDGATKLPAASTSDES